MLFGVLLSGDGGTSHMDYNYHLAALGNSKTIKTTFHDLSSYLKMFVKVQEHLL